MQNVNHLSTETSREEIPENLPKTQPEQGLTALSLEAMMLVAGGDSIIVWPV